LFKFGNLSIQFTHKGILKLAVPLMLASLIEHVIGLVDTSLLSGLSDEELGGAGLGIHTYFFLFMISFGLTAALQIIFSRRIGEKHEDLVGKSFINGAILLFFYYLISIVFVYGFGQDVLSGVISNPAVSDSMYDYLSTRGLGMIFTCISALYGSFYISINKSYAITISSVLVLSTNWILDIALINGKWGFPEMRVAGAALASMIASLIGMITLFLLSFKFKAQKKYQLYKLRSISWKEQFDILKIAYPLIFQMFISFFGWTFFFFMVEKMGAVPLSISSFLRPIYILFLLPFVSFGSTTGSMISNLIGQNRQTEVNSFIKKMLQTTIPSGLIISLVGVVFAGNILNGLSDNQELISNSKSSLIVISSSIFLYSIGSVYFNAITGTGNTKRTLLVEIITMTAYLIPVYLFVSVFHLSIEWVWATEHIYFLAMGVTSYLFFKGTKLVRV
jgi:multidrug resistance protein, MATE family